MRLSRNTERFEYAESRFRETLRRHGQKWTSERRRILEVLEAQRGHFTADELVDALHGARASASRATVYRALPLLVESGLVRPMLLGGEVRRYESTLGPHHDHLVCVQCGTIVEFEFEAFEILQREVASQHQFRLLGHLHELHGVCHACEAKEGSGASAARPAEARPGPGRTGRGARTTREDT